MTQRRGKTLRPGAVLLAQIADNLPPGSELQGTRPVIVVAVPEQIGPQRFPVLVVVPLTKATGRWVERNPVLYPRFKAGQGGLSLDSTALIDHVQAVDRTRVIKGYGYLTADEFAPIKVGLERMLAANG